MKNKTKEEIHDKQNQMDWELELEWRRCENSKRESQNTEQCPSARARCCNKIKCAEVPKDQCCSSGKSMSQYNLIL